MLFVSPMERVYTTASSLAMYPFWALRVLTWLIVAIIELTDPFADCGGSVALGLNDEWLNANWLPCTATGGIRMGARGNGRCESGAWSRNSMFCNC